MKTAGAHKHDFSRGDSCAKCGKKKAPQGRPRGATRKESAPPAARRPLVRPAPITRPAPPARERDDFDDDDELAEVFGHARADVETDEDSAAAGETPPAAPSWCGIAGSLVGDGALVVAKGLVRRSGWEPGPVDPTKKARLDDALGRQLAIWFPDKELPPWGEAVMILLAITGGMRATGRRLPPKVPPAGAAVAGPSGASTATGISAPPTSSSNSPDVDYGPVS